MFSTLNPIEIKSIEVSNISWTKTENYKMASEIVQHKSNSNRQSVIFKDTQIPQGARDKLSSLLKNEHDSIISKSFTDVGRSNLFKMDITTTGPPIAHKPYPISLSTKNSLMRKYDY